MRVILIAAAILAASPALADPDSYIAEQWAKIAALRAANAKAATEQKDACARLGNVRVGLNPEGVLKSCWGKPLKINITTFADHRTEQWVYGPSHYVYLTDGLVTAIQSAR